MTVHTYRFLFAPGTIGSITFPAQNIERVDKIKHGLVLTRLRLGPPRLVAELVG